MDTHENNQGYDYLRKCFRNPDLPKAERKYDQSKAGQTKRAALAAWEDQLEAKRLADELGDL